MLRIWHADASDWLLLALRGILEGRDFWELPLGQALSAY